MTNDYIKRQVEQRQRAWDAAKGLLDTAAAEGRDLTSEEEASYGKMNEELNERAIRIEALKADATREAKIELATREIAGQVRSMEKATVQDADVIRAMARGEVRGHTFEQRDVTTASTGAPVPTSFFNQVIEQARLVGPMLETSTTLRTAGGENLQLPSNNQFSTAAIVGQGSAFAESDPVFNSFISLSAFKYGFLVQLSRELIEDAGVDILSFIATQTGNALGFKVNNDLTVGTGSDQPNGVVTASTLGKTGASTATFTADDLIDLVYSVNGAVRRLPGLGFMCNTSSLGAIRKLKDNAGNFVFSPALADGNDQILSYSVFENPAMASNGSATKSVLFGHLPSYYVRMAGGLRLDRSDDFAFSTDLVTFRASMRVDGDLPQTSHIKHFINLAA